MRKKKADWLYCKAVAVQMQLASTASSRLFHRFCMMGRTRTRISEKDRPFMGKRIGAIDAGSTEW